MWNLNISTSCLRLLDPHVHRNWCLKKVQQRLAEYRTLKCVPSVGYERVKNTGWPFSGSQLLPAVLILQMSDMALNHTEQISHQKQQTSDTGTELTVLWAEGECGKPFLKEDWATYIYCLGVKMDYNKKLFGVKKKKKSDIFFLSFKLGRMLKEENGTG